MTLSASKFSARCKKLFDAPEHKWRPLAAAAMGQNWFTIDRYSKGALAIPKRTEWALYGLEMCKKHEPKVWAELMEGWSEK